MNKPSIFYRLIARQALSELREVLSRIEPTILPSYHVRDLKRRQLSATLDLYSDAHDAGNTHDMQLLEFNEGLRDRSPDEVNP